MKAAGIHPTLDEIVWINDLSRQVENPKGGEHRHLAGAPSRAGNVWLWPFTINGERWYEATLEWFDGNAKFELYALAFALAKGREAGAFQFLTGYHSAKKAIDEFVGDLDCTQDELEAAMKDVLPIDDEINEIETRLKAEYNAKHDIAEEEKEEADWDGMVAHLQAATGLPEDAWRRQHSKDVALRVLNAVLKQHEALAGGSDNDAPDPEDPYMVANKRLGLAIREIKRRHAQKEVVQDGG